MEEFNHHKIPKDTNSLKSLYAPLRLLSLDLFKSKQKQLKLTKNTKTKSTKQIKKLQQKKN